MSDARAIERIGAACLVCGAAAWLWAFSVAQAPTSPWHLPGTPRAVDVLATRAWITGLACYALAPRMRAVSRATVALAAAGALLALGADAASAWTGWLGVQLRDARDGARWILVARLAGGAAQAASLTLALRATRANGG